MSVEQESIAAAVAVVGYDLLQNSSMRQSNKNRTLIAAGLQGSAAAGDTEVELTIGTNRVGKLFNVTTGFPNRDAMFRVGQPVPSGEEVHAYVRDAPATNPINIALDFDVQG